MRAGTREAIILTLSTNRIEHDPTDNTENLESEHVESRPAPNKPDGANDGGANDNGATEGAHDGTGHQDSGHRDSESTTEQHISPADTSSGDEQAGSGAAPAPFADDNPAFSAFDVAPEIIRALQESGIENTFAIQKLTLPLALRGEDLIGQARTGTGKTLGFGVPLLQRLQVPGDGTPQALVVVPTRELCTQVARDLAEASKHLGIRTLAIYGGRPYEEQIDALRGGVDLVIGTPGRLLDLADQQQLVLGKVRGLVLDEADEMLDLGFLPDIERILTMVPEQRQTMLFSATMPGPIITLARKFLQQPTHIRAEEADAGSIHERTRQFVYRAHAMDKTEMLARVLQARGRGLTMIFSRTKRTAQRLSDDLAERGFAVAAVHGDLGQGAREKSLRAFRTGKVDILVATDVAARGIDVSGVTHVINLQCPEDEKNYVHRIGRTGRAGEEGVAITLVDWDEQPRWKVISDALELGAPEPVETYSTSPHLYADLNIPSDATGRLPLSQRTRVGLDAEPGEDTKAKRKPRRRARNASSGPASGSGDGDGGNRRDTAEARPAGRTRRRRRTRGGAAVSGDSNAEAQPAEAPATTPAAAPAAAGDSTGGGQKPRRRRRRRGGSGGASSE